MPQRSAEAQANLFAAHFLAPDHLARTCANATELCLTFDYPGDYVEHRIYDLKKRSRFHIGEPCAQCGNFTLVRVRGGLR